MLAVRIHYDNGIAACHFESSAESMLLAEVAAQACCSEHREVFRLLTFPDCEELITLKPPLVVPMRSACFSPDGKRLWLIAANYRLFEWNFGQLRTELARLGLGWDQP